MNVCVIDIGSNTVKASIYKIFGKNLKTEIAFKGRKEKLISYVDINKKMSYEGISRLVAAIDDLICFANMHNSEKVYAFATASLRGVINTEEIISLIDSKYSLQIEILSEEEEALCSLKGLLGDHECCQSKNGIMIDMGGGSTEVVVFENGKLPIIKSLHFGCVSLTRDGIISENALELIHAELSKCGYINDLGCPVYLIGGTARAVLKIVNTMQNTNSKNLKTDASDFSLILNNVNNSEFVKDIERIIPSRISTVFSGALAFRELIRTINPSTLIVSDSGVRDGYLEKVLP